MLVPPTSLVIGPLEEYGTYVGHEETVFQEHRAGSRVVYVYRDRVTFGHAVVYCYMQLGIELIGVIREIGPADDSEY